MKVLHIINDKEGGIKTVVSNLCESIEFSNFYNVSNFLEVISTHKKIKYLIREKKIDLVHLHGAWTLHLLLVRNKLNVPLIISPHGALDKASLKKSSIKKSIVKYLYMKKAYLNADYLHALTEKEKENIENWGINKIPIKVIPNGIKFEKKIELNRSLKKELLDLAKNRKIILTLSRLHHAKGIELLIHAYRDLKTKDAVLFIVGSGSKSYERKLQKIISKFRLESKVFLLGVLEGVDKNTVYEISDIFVLPSFTEGFGLTVLEAYRQKLPVITTTATPFEWIGEEKCGWYVEIQKEKLLNALNEAILLDNEELRKKGEKGNEIIKKKYRIEEILGEYRNLYSKAINKK